MRPRLKGERGRNNCDDEISSAHGSVWFLWNCTEKWGGSASSHTRFCEVRGTNPAPGPHALSLAFGNFLKSASLSCKRAERSWEILVEMEKSHMLINAGQRTTEMILPESSLAGWTRSLENVTSFSPVIPFLGSHTKAAITYVRRVCGGKWSSKCYL